MSSSSIKRVLAIFFASFGMVGALLISVPAQAAMDPESASLETVSADGLPTVQINGVVWDQHIVGDTVYVGGEFTMARPSGSAPGVNEVSRQNLLAYNLHTGELINSWNPSTNAQVKSISSNADGSVIYVAGSFTQINGINRGRVAALDPVTGAVQANLTTGFDSTINSVVWTPDALYVGGHFNRANSTPRTKVAAISPTNGAILPFAPNLPDRNVQAVTVSPDGTKVAIGGAFTSANGSNNPGYGLVLVDAATGQTNLPLAANQFIRNAGEKAAILALSSDADGFYGVGYVSGPKSGTTEGTFGIDWDGNLIWVDDCHGDSYDIMPAGDIVYVASHKHYCSNLGTGGFPQTDPWPYYRATAHSKAATGISQRDIFPNSYLDQFGQPSNTLLNWFPDVNAGTYTGQGQGTWDVDANDDYVVMGGEFTRVNNAGQQGIVRFAKKDIAPDSQGPRTLDKPLQATVRPVAAGINRITWPAMWDRDDESITYKVFRNDVGTLVHETTQHARFWEARSMGFTDRGLTPGSTVQYRIQASDPSGNTAWSPWTSVTVASSGTLSDYASTVLDAEPLKYWRFGESGRTLLDWGGTDDTQTGSGATRGSAGAIIGDSDGATRFRGANSSVTFSTEQILAPDEFSIEGWFKTNSTGVIAGFGDRVGRDSANHDRKVYLDSSGRLNFGVYPGATQETTIVRSNDNLRDNQWHYFVATLDKEGLSLYLDGRKVGSRSDVERGQNIFGYWRIGGDNTWSGNRYFNGDIDEIAIYPRALTAEEVDAHWTASGRTSNLPTKPTDSYGEAVFDDDPDFFWRLDETSGGVANDTTWNGNSGNYVGERTLGRPGMMTGSNAVLLPEPVPGGWFGIGAKDGGNVVAGSSVANPTTFTQEVWVKTTATSGGRIMGFGSSAGVNTSDSYDRHLQLLDTGQVMFGVYPGEEVRITSTTAINDGQWHHVVSSLGPDGMKLYVDGKLEAADPNTGAENYSGYWKIGGDNTWAGSSNNYLSSAEFDEAAVYSRVLSLGEIQDHFASSGRQNFNTPPTSTFEFEIDNFDVTFDSTGSGDAEGGITYAWNFGDGNTSTLVHPSHTYESAGTYEVSLVVTDTGGATHTTTKDVTVLGPNLEPVASFSHDVDGLDVSFTSTSLDPDGMIESYEWDFGDGATSTEQNPTHTYANGVERTVTLTVTDDRGATATATSTVDPDELPVADFTHTSSAKRAAFVSTSSDDGAIVSHVWDFGDGSSSIATNPIHDYADYGDYTVTLTVTDNSGNSVSVSHDVTIEPAPNQMPTANFVYTVAGTTVSFDGGGSYDPEGPIASYEWNFGDGAVATGQTTGHTYGDSGVYTVTLKVTDADGAVDEQSRDVTIVIPEEGEQWAKDDFTRTFVNGWGAADIGGEWDLTGPGSAFSVSDGAGHVNAGAGQERKSNLLSVTSDEADATFDYRFGIDVEGSGNSWLDFVGRRVDNSNFYRSRIITNSSGAVRVDLTRVAGGSSNTLGSVTVPGLTMQAGETLKVRTQTLGTSPTMLKVKVWKAGDSEPEAWTLERTDETSALQTEGGVGFIYYVSGSVTNGPQTFTIDNLAVKTEGVLPVNQEPIATFTSSVNEGELTVDGSGSTDPDGTIANYAWNFGDGSTATGATATHNYGTSGTYTVTLTVTDEDGATGSVSHDVEVTVTNPDPDPDPDPEPEPNFVEDDFERNVANGWGTSPVGGAWSITGGSASPFEVSDGTGKVSLNAGGGRTAWLNEVSSDSTDLTYEYSLSRATDGTSSTMLDTITRSVSSGNNYHARLVIYGDGYVRVDLARLVSNSKTTLGAMIVPGLTVTPGEKLNVRLQTEGTGTTDLRVKVWKAGEAEPDEWTMERSDDTSVLQTAGAVGMYFYLSGAAGPGAQVYSIDNIVAKAVGATPAPVPDPEPDPDPGPGPDPDPDPGAGPDPDPEPDPEPGANFVEDDFARVVANGWGTSVLGGAWSITGGSGAPFQVADGTGQVSLTAGQGRTAWLNEVSSDSTDLTYEYSLSRATDGSSSTMLDTITRSVNANNNYHARIVVYGDGNVRVDLARLVAGSKTTLGAMNVPDLSLAPDEKLNVRLQTEGTGTTNLRVKVWKAGEDEPDDWTMERTDNTSSLQTAGAIGMYFYLSGSAGPGAQVYTIDNLLAKPVE